MVFIDESGFMLQPLVRRTWSMRGHTPELKAWDRHERLTAITALVYEAHKPEPIRMIFEIQRHNANATTFFMFLLHLHRELRNQMIVIWDRLSAHRKTEKYFKQLECSWASFEYLPGYCPQLNPVEHVWSLAKYGHMSNWPAPNIEQLRIRLESELESQKTNAQLLRSHFDWAKLLLD